MKTKTQVTVPTLTILIVAFSIQFVSCKKDSTSVNNVNSSTQIDNLSIDSLSTGLVAWYTFDGDVLDHSGNNNNVIFNSAQPAKGKGGIPKTAYLFDGIASYMQVTNSNTLNPKKITLYAVIKPKGFYAGTCHDNRVISKGYDDTWNGRYTLGYNDQPYYNYNGCFDTVATKFENFVGVFGDGQGTSSGVHDPLDNIKTNRWYNIAYTYNGVYSKFYVNGVLRAQAMVSTTFTPSTQDVFFGRNEDPNYPYYFNGIIDEIRIYKRALTANEIQQLSSQ